MSFKDERRSLLASGARIQVPWIKVTIGSYTFGVFSKTSGTKQDDKGVYYTAYNITYPNYVKSLSINKINGQINEYSLQLVYPVTLNDDPNFFEKVFSSVSQTRKIIFSYGDMSMPSYIYKDEEALITDVKTSFNLQGGIINYTVSAISSASLNTSGSFSFAGRFAKPSSVIKEVFKTEKYGLRKLFTGMNDANLNTLVRGDDKAVDICSKTNISPIDYVTYLVSLMMPGSTPQGKTNSDVYILTIHDDTSYEALYTNNLSINGPYFKVDRVSQGVNKSDAFELDIGFGNNSTIVTNFSVEDQQNYSLLYDYNEKLESQNYVRRLNNNGEWEDVWSPSLTSKNDHFLTRAEDIVWWTKVTKFPIKASVTIQGLLRPAILMTYVRINVIFPGGHKHIASGLYLVTKQQDTIGEGTGYKTTLSLVKIDGDASPSTTV